MIDALHPSEEPGRPATVAAQLTVHAASLGLDLRSDQIEQLTRYLELLQRWNKVYNLTAVRDPQQMLGQHLLDCLAAAPSLARAVESSASHSTGEASPQILDVGSGAGLPGAVLAILFPHWTVCCIDAVAKKIAFLTNVAGTLSLPNLRPVHARVQDLKQRDFSLITCRAFASLPDFTAWTRDHLAATGQWAAMKGHLPTDEIANLDPSIEVFHVEPLNVPTLNAARCIVWMRPRARQTAP
ncbi:MAG: 16S rRNA (guanine(527)-N(7))-methyltransferase RsmG [Rubrivivax sp.]|jgi:16S rRNA (guanine527-N7)-methyltransferase